MNEINKTLYIPLYGKAFVSKRKIILEDKTAESIWAKEEFTLKRKSKSKWLAFYMAMRARVFDDWTKLELEKNPNAVVLHLGCGMDSRERRVNDNSRLWYDIDFPDVISARKKYFSESNSYRMLGVDLKDEKFADMLPHSDCAVVIMEGISMYFSPEELNKLFTLLCGRFSKLSLLCDCYGELAAKLSKFKNPVNDVGVRSLYGIDNPKDLQTENGLIFLSEREITPDFLINELQGFEKFLFKRLYAGKIAKKSYRLYEYTKS